jgi:hypothetical protein
VVVVIDLATDALYLFAHSRPPGSGVVVVVPT